MYSPTCSCAMWASRSRRMVSIAACCSRSRAAASNSRALRSASSCAAACWASLASWATRAAAAVSCCAEAAEVARVCCAGGACVVVFRLLPCRQRLECRTMSWYPCRAVSDRGEGAAARLTAELRLTGSSGVRSEAGVASGRHVWVMCGATILDAVRAATCFSASVHCAKMAKYEL